MIHLIKLSFLLVLAGFTFLPTGKSIAQQSPFTASVNQNTVPLNGKFQISFRIEGSSKNFKPPSFTDMNLLGGPSRSSSIQFINGQKSESLTYTYVLQPKRIGKITIGEASAEIDGKIFKTNKISITATAASAQDNRTNQQASQSGVTEKNIFIRAIVSKTDPYIGEAIRVTYKLYANVNIVNYGVDKLPALSGFWTQDIEVSTPLQLKEEVVDGVRYSSAVLKQAILFPQQAGELTIDPLEVEFIARINSGTSNSNDPFAMFFGRTRDVRYIAGSPVIKITVKNLPGGAPPSFNGAVGDLQFKAALDKTEIPSNEPVTLTVTVSGSGNLNLLDPPNVEFPPDVESFDPKVNDNIAVSGNNMNGSKTFEYLLIPRLAGSYEIDPLEFSYFDLASKSYKTIRTNGFELNVLKDGENQVAVSGGSMKSDFQLLNEDIRFIKTGRTSFVHTGNRFYGSMMFYSLLLLPVLLFGISLFYKGKSDALRNDTVALKQRKATRIAHKKLRLARKFMSEGKHAEVYEEISKALWGFIVDKLNIPLSSLSSDNAANKLKSLGVPQDIIEDLVQTVEQCEQARFSPVDSAGNIEVIYKRAVSVIEKIQEQIK